MAGFSEPAYGKAKILSAIHISSAGYVILVYFYLYTY